MDGSATVDLCAVYHQPPRQNLIGHLWAARMDLLPRDCGPSARRPLPLRLIQLIDLCNYGSLRCTAIEDAQRNSIFSLKSAACP
jgi:hypothetical protein